MAAASVPHIVWGNVEEMSKSSSNDSDQIRQPPMREHGPVPGMCRKNLLTQRMQDYIESITFKESSSESASSPGNFRELARFNQYAGNAAQTSHADNRAQTGQDEEWILPTGAPSQAIAAATALVGFEETDGQDDDIDYDAYECPDDLVQSILKAMSTEEREGIIAVLMQGQGLQDQAEGINWSEGSSLHREGRCRPCRFVFTHIGCSNGSGCRFCHLPHTKKSRPRPCKTRRVQCKRFLDMLEQVRDDSPEKFQKAVEMVGKHSPYLQSIIQKRFSIGPALGPDPYHQLHQTSCASDPAEPVWKPMKNVLSL